MERPEPRERSARPGCLGAVGHLDFGGGLISGELNASAAVLHLPGTRTGGLLLLLPFLHVPTGRYMVTAVMAGVLARSHSPPFTGPWPRADVPGRADHRERHCHPGTDRPGQGRASERAQLSGIAVTLTGIVLASGPELRSGVPVRRQALSCRSALPSVSAPPTPCSRWRPGSGVYGTLLCQRIGGLVVLAPIVLRGRPCRASADQPAGRRPGRVGGCDIVANGSYALAASRGDLSIAAVLASLYPVVTALLARYVLSERLRPVQSIGGSPRSAACLLSS